MIRPTFRPFLSAALLLVTLGPGCGGVFDDQELVPLDKVPAPILEAAQKTLPDVKFDTAYREKEGETAVYELRGKDPRGKLREVEVTPDGKIFNVE